MGIPSDNELADEAIRSKYWRQGRQFMRYWEVPNFVRESLRNHYEKDLGPQMFEMMVQRVTNLLRSRWATKAAETRKKRKEGRVKAIDKTIDKVMQESRAPELKLVGGGRNK